MKREDIADEAEMQLAISKGSRNAANEGHDDGECLSSAKLRSTDSVNPRAVLSRVRPRYRHLL